MIATVTGVAQTGHNNVHSKGHNTRNASGGELPKTRQAALNALLKAQHESRHLRKVLYGTYLDFSKRIYAAEQERLRSEWRIGVGGLVLGLVCVTLWNQRRRLSDKVTVWHARNQKRSPMIANIKQCRDYIRKIIHLHNQLPAQDAQTLSKVEDALLDLMNEADRDKNYDFQQLLVRPYGKIRQYLKSDYPTSQIRSKIQAELRSLLEAAEAMVANAEKQNSSAKLPHNTTHIQPGTGATLDQGSSCVTEQNRHEAAPTIESLQSQLIQEREARQALENNYRINLDRLSQENESLHEKTTGLERLQGQNLSALEDKERQITDLSQAKEQLGHEVGRLNEEIRNLRNDVDKLMAEQRELANMEALLARIKGETSAYPDTLKRFAEGLIEVAEHINTSSWAAENLEKLDRYVYRSPEAVTLLAKKQAIQPTDISRILALQSLADAKLRACGFDLIYPSRGDDFNSSEHSFTERDLVITNTDQSLSNKIHSVVRIGYKRGGTVLRRAEVKRYLYSGEQSPKGQDISIRLNSLPYHLLEAIKKEAGDDPEEWILAHLRKTLDKKDSAGQEAANAGFNTPVALACPPEKEPDTLQKGDTIKKEGSSSLQQPGLSAKPIEPKLEAPVEDISTAIFATTQPPSHMNNKDKDGDRQ